jgi:hypothetical protein
MIYYKTYFFIVIPYIIVIVIIKIFPIYTLRNDKIKLKDIYFSIFLFIIYLFWLKMNNKSISYVLNQVKIVITENKV